MEDALALLAHDKVGEPASTERAHVARDDALLRRALGFAADDLDFDVWCRVGADGIEMS